MDKALYDIHTAIDKGFNFLHGNKGKNGYWRDFKTLAGESDEWISAYVATILATHGNEREKISAHKTLSLLLRTNWWKQGWGYNRHVPADADSTIWVTRLYQTVMGNHRNRRIKKAQSFLQNHLSDGGISTYANSFSIRVFTRLTNSNVSFKGWCAPHPCVTAAFCRIEHPGHMTALNRIRLLQNSNGSWNSYWWKDKEYTTALACEALSSTKIEEDKKRCEAAVRWVKSQMNSVPFSPFVAALWLTTLLCVESSNNNEIEVLTSYLLKEQKNNGGWHSSAYLRIPKPGETDPDSVTIWTQNAGGGGSIQFDQHGLFTTATVINALAVLIDNLKTKELLEP